MRYRKLLLRNPRISEGILGAVTQCALGRSLAQQQIQLGTIGFKSFREHLYWDDYELTAGVYSKTALPAGIQDMLNGKVDVSKSILVLAFGNPLYESGQRPITAPGRTAFTNFARAVMLDGGWRFGFIEIWNAWNIPFGGMTGNGTAADYALLFNAVAPVIRGFGSKVLVGGITQIWTGPATEDWDHSYTQGIVDGGVLDYADGVGYRAYNYNAAAASSPVGATNGMITRIDQVQKILSDKVKGPFPMYITEYGWPNHTGFGMTEDLAGRFIQEFIDWAETRPFIKGTWLYELRDSGSVQSVEANTFGVFDSLDADKARIGYFTRIGTLTSGSDPSVLLFDAEKFLITTVTAPSGNSNQDRYLRGGYFDNSIWSTSSTFRHWGLCIVTTGAATPLAASNYVDMFFENVTGPDGNTTRAFAISLKADSPNTGVEQGRVTDYQSPGLPGVGGRVEPKHYLRMFLKFDVNTAARGARIGSSNFFQIFWEPKCEPDYRFRTQLRWNGTKLTWQSHDDVLTNANEIHSGINSTTNVVLAAQNSSAGWHRFEVYMDRVNGIWRTAVDGVNIINLTGVNLMGASGNIMNFPMYFQNYSTVVMAGMAAAGDGPAKILFGNMIIRDIPPADAWQAGGW